MMLARLFTALSLALAATAHAQPAPAGGVKESTDPARAAAVEGAAAELKTRPARAPVALARARTAAGHQLLSGGITAGDRNTMEAEKLQYSLWVATVAKPSGAYLADTELRISDLKSKAVVLERKMEGPWLMLALPPGIYEVAASFREAGTEQTQRLVTRVTVPAKGLRQAMLRFDSKAMVEPEGQASAR
jgi:hypothetical protein